MPRGPYYTGTNFSGGFSMKSDSYRYLKCGHVFPVAQLGPPPPPECPICSQQHTLHSAMQAKQAAQQQEYMNQIMSPFSASPWGSPGRTQQAPSPPREPTIMEWLDGEVAAVCKLAFAA